MLCPFLRVIIPKRSQARCPSGFDPSCPAPCRLCTVPLPCRLLSSWSAARRDPAPVVTPGGPSAPRLLLRHCPVSPHAPTCSIPSCRGQIHGEGARGPLAQPQAVVFQRHFKSSEFGAGFHRKSKRQISARKAASWKLLSICSTSWESKNFSRR